MPHCSICNADFEAHFRYQREERTVDLGGGVAERSVFYFCSQRCLEASHHKQAEGLVGCSFCQTAFEVEFAYQVLFTGDRRQYVCSTGCRDAIKQSASAARLGEFLDPTRRAHTEQGANDALLEASTPPSTIAAPAMRPVLASNQYSANTGNAASGARRSPERGTGGPHVLALFNHKGGTAKTTSAISIAAGLAAKGRRVLLVDSDGQGNVAVSLGLKFERSLYHVLVMGLDPRQALLEVRPNFHVLPSNETLAAAELYLAGRRQRDKILASRLAEVKHEFDHVIIDCSPSLSLLNQNALVAADAVLCPVACDYLALIGVRQVLRTLKHVNQFLRHPVKLWGILPTFFDARARICYEALEAMQERFQERCLRPVRMASKVKEAPAQGKTLLEYAPTSTAAADYRAVVERLLSTSSEEPVTTAAVLGGAA